MGTTTRATAGFTLGGLLVATVVTLGLGAALKASCATGRWGDGRQYRRLCYSDIVPLYGTEQLMGSRLPYLDRCSPVEGRECDEYPVLTMYFMRLSAWISHGVKRTLGPMSGYGSFFWVNALLLAFCAMLTTWALWQVGGERAMYFAFAPTLLIYAFMNWDLFAVALAALAALAFVRRRDSWSGILLGLGAAAKLYPGLLVIPFFLSRLREGNRRGGVRLAAAAVGAWAIVDVPFALAAPGSWSTFFRFNASRSADWDSVWFIVCHRLHAELSCPWSTGWVNALSVVAFVAIGASVWSARRRRQPDFPRWTFAFPLLVAFLLTNKVYSPQYGLWLLPWFALALPSPWLFTAFEAADVAVFVTRFSWFGRLSGFGGVPIGAFEAAVLIRAAVLVACLVAWTVAPPRDLAVMPSKATAAPLPQAA